MTKARKAKPARRGRKAPRPARPGTKRAKVIALMQRKGGATLDQIKRATKWDTKTAMDGIRLVRVASGYKVREVGERFCIGRPAGKRRGHAAQGADATGTGKTTLEQRAVNREARVDLVGAGLALRVGREALVRVEEH
jgi:hypothetical protein